MLTARQSVDYIFECMQTMFEATKMTPDKKFSLRREFVKSEYMNLYKKFCVKAQMNFSEYPITTVKNQSVYSIPTDTVNLYYVFYESALDVWRIKKIDTVSEKVMAKGVSTSYDPSFYEVDLKAHTITLYPAPSLDGEVLTLYLTRVVPDLGDNEYPIVPEDFQTDLCDYAVARLSIIMGMFDPKYQNAVTLGSKLEKDVAEAANDCRKRMNFKIDQPGFIKDRYLLRMNTFNEPIVNHNPTVNRIQYISDIQFANHSTGYLGMKVSTADGLQVYDDTTGAEVVQIDTTGIYINGVKLEFIGLGGNANFAGNGGATGTTITIADQGSASDYDVKIQAYGDSSIVGTVGEITVDKISGTQFIVYNAGVATSAFYYEITIS